MEPNNKNLHPESEEELLEKLGRSRKDPPDETDYARVFGKKIPGTYVYFQNWVYEYGFESIDHMIAYCIYHKISMEEITGEEFEYPPEDALI